MTPRSELYDVQYVFQIWSVFVYIAYRFYVSACFITTLFSYHILTGLEHRRSQGVQWVQVHPQGEK